MVVATSVRKIGNAQGGKVMASDALAAKAHELIEQLDAGKLAAVVHLLEVMVGEDELVTDEERRRFHEGQAFFASGKGIPMEEVLADFGLTLEDFPLDK
jgi:hypothetical protein